MAKKITFLMGTPEAKKHSTRFDLDHIESIEENGAVAQEAPAWVKTFKPSFYVPNPVGQAAKRLRVTIEELEG